MTFVKVFTFLFFCFVAINAQIPCDDHYGQHCPEANGFAVGDCLKQLDQSTLGASCQDYIALHDACLTDITEHCPGKEYTGDLLVCLNEWTSPSLLSPTCVEALPKKEVKEKKKLSKEEKQKADKRRKIRNKAAKMARDL